MQRYDFQRNKTPLRQAAQRVNLEYMRINSAIILTNKSITGFRVVDISANRPWGGVAVNRYDDRARLVFHFAREEGSKLGHAMIGPEHLLLGLMREGGTASKVLSEFGATLEGFRRQVEEMVGRG